MTLEEYLSHLNQREPVRVRFAPYPLDKGDRYGELFAEAQRNPETRAVLTPAEVQDLRRDGQIISAEPSDGSLPECSANMNATDIARVLAAPVGDPVYRFGDTFVPAGAALWLLRSRSYSGYMWYGWSDHSDLYDKDGKALKWENKTRYKEINRVESTSHGVSDRESLVNIIGDAKYMVYFHADGHGTADFSEIILYVRRGDTFVEIDTAQIGWGTEVVWGDDGEEHEERVSLDRFLKQKTWDSLPTALQNILAAYYQADEGVKHAE